MSSINIVECSTCKRPGPDYLPCKSCARCGYPPQHDETEVPSGAAVGGWAHGEPTHILRCRRCGSERGPFVDNSGEAGF